MVFGHVHQLHDSTRGGVRLLGTPSTCAQFKPACKEFTIDDKPPAYRRLELFADGRIDTKVVWLDDA